ncbi:uncharacterized protein LOC132047511 [Lycium ferocissimum]|uniref:uncharacterized protein LOC132047511 n=1 Tax=Lycium ferocissimum TaxID=112874 RepID=UPI002816861B|nr:uncharacterized protein LOC132047511 [Lycium ferocissimum]
MQTRFAVSSATKLQRLLFAQSHKSAEYFPYRFSSSTGRTADPAVHSGPLEGDDLEESVKFAENERKQPNIKPSKDNEAFTPPKSPIGSSQKIESTGVNQPIDPLTLQKRHYSNTSTTNNKESFKDVNCIGLDGTPWPDEEKDGRAQLEDDREYFKHHKPSPLAEMEMADTRKPITRATDAPPGAGIAFYPAPDGGVTVWRPEQLATAEETLMRAVEIWKENAMRGDPDSPQGRILRQLRGENW